MNRKFYGLCLIAFIFCAVFYLMLNRLLLSDASRAMPGSDASFKNLNGHPPVGHNAAIRSKKKCTCCGETRLQIRDFAQKRRVEIEAWARETIRTHGYEEGMKRVTARSPILAKRLQRILEKGTVPLTPIPSQESE